MDLRNLSRDWPTCGNQALMDLRLNPFGLELFVESYWDVIAMLVEDKMDFPREKLIREFKYRGMTIRLDPTVGLEAWDAEDRPQDTEARRKAMLDAMRRD